MSERREFFVPAARNRDEAEQVWASTKKFTEEQTGWAVTDRRILRLDYMHDGKHMEAEVGVVHPYGGPVTWEEPPTGPSEEPVLVILERDEGLFLVCTENRGVVRGEPILVGSGEPYQVVYFDGFGPS